MKILDFFGKKMARKLSVLIALMVLIIFIVTGTLIYNNTKTQLRKDIEEKISLNSKRVVDDISNVFEAVEIISNQSVTNKQITEYIKGVSSREEIRTHPLYQPVKETLKDIKESEDFLSGTWVANYDVNYYLDAAEIVSEPHYDVATRPWYTPANSTEGVIFTDPYTYEGVLYISCIQTVSENNKNIGVTSIDMSLNAMPGIMNRHRIGEKGTNILLSSDGTYIYTDDDSKIINEKATDDDALKEYAIAALAGESDIKKVTYNGIKYYLSYEPVNINGWVVISLANEDEVMAPLKRTISKLIISFIIACLLLIILNYFIISKSIKPIEKLTKLIKAMASGDYTRNVSENFIERRDEIGELSKAFEILSKNMNEVIFNINEASEQVASGSRQVSDSSIALSQGATEQASSIEQLTASIQQIHSQTKQNAENADEAKEIAEDAKVNASEGNEEMKKMLRAMDDINDSSKNIFKIIKVIDEIAFQTNMLALNAAVEAARAGGHGKGFAVVAEEVRNLAARSANAAKETTALIEGSINKVQEGAKIANNTAEALYKIVEGVSKATNLVNAIAEASNEQAIGVNQVNQGINQIANVVQTTSATSEETASASEELSSQAEMLKEQISAFKLKKNNSDTSNNIKNRDNDIAHLPRIELS